jgi:LPXTG-site transpeptidase (sortase) family protein
VKLSRINTLLLGMIIMINGYIILLPLLPNITFWLQRNNTARAKTLTKTIHEASQPTTNNAPDTSADPSNSLIIPRIGLNQAMHEGQSAATLRQGLWRRPASSTPDKGSNTVIVGHRLTYTNPRGALYHLDKLRPGDEIGIRYKDRRYLYKVTETRVVAATATEVEAPSKMPLLTIYTCTPLWLPKDRLVVVAALESIL